MPVAIVCRPALTFSKAINVWFRGEHPEGGAIDIVAAASQHAAYVSALKACGLEILELPSDERFPDACFTQDPVVLHGNKVLILRMRAESRRGEGEAFRKLLAGRGFSVEEMKAGYCDGGDVMVMADIKTVWVGLSARTDRAGFEAIRDFYGQFGFAAEAIGVDRCLHLTTGATYLGGRRVLGSEMIDAEPFVRQGFAYLAVPSEEKYASNVLILGRNAIVPEGYPHTQALLAKLGFKILTTPMSEFGKADGGVTCLYKLLS